MEKETRYYSVGELCRKTGITRKTLFYYDHTGLLNPSLRIGIQEHKVYTEDACMRLGKILRLRNAGLTLKEIRLILDEPDTPVLSVLETAAQRLREERIRLDGQLCLLEELISEYR